jgi:hypothetical protein
LTCGDSFHQSLEGVCFPSGLLGSWTSQLAKWSWQHFFRIPLDFWQMHGRNWCGPMRCYPWCLMNKQRGSCED